MINSQFPAQMKHKLRRITWQFICLLMIMSMVQCRKGPVEPVWTTFSYADGLANNMVHDIAIGMDEKIWFGTYGGVSVYDGAVWTNYLDSDGLAENQVTSVAIESDRIIWFGTGLSGVSRLSFE